MGDLVEQCFAKSSQKLLHHRKNKEDKKERDILEEMDEHIVEAKRGLEDTVGLWLFAVAVGALVYKIALGIGWIDVFYFVIASLSTTGYGDIHPQSRVGKVVATLWLVLVTTGFVMVLGKYGEWRALVQQKKLVKEIAGGKMSKDVWEDVDRDHDGQISEVEFLAGALIRMGKCSKEDVDGIMKSFKKLDKDNSHSVDRSEIIVND